MVDHKEDKHLFRVAAVGDMEIEGTMRRGVFLEGDIPAIRSVSMLLGDQVTVADALDADQ